MAYRLTQPDSLIGSDTLPTQDGLQAYDLINDDIADQLMDELLYERSACEFVRDQLSDDQRADLDRVDAFWRVNAHLFNETFAVWHSNVVREVAMDGWVADRHGIAPIIPRSHWWWWPIDPEQGEAA